jgi:uncharacterized protein (TIGR02646 family)
MIRLSRPALTPEHTAYLQAQSQLIVSSADPKGEATERWKNFRGPERKALQAVLTQMASGLKRCMYCEDSMGTDIDHFAPKAEFPLLTFDWNNHLLACSFCNSNMKRNRYPVDAAGSPLLLNPAVDEPQDHLTLSPSTGRYEARDSKGKESIDVFGLNRDICVGGRRDAWIAACELLRGYDRCILGEKVAEAASIVQVLRNAPFQAVFKELRRLGCSDNSIVPPDVRLVIQAHFAEMTSS